MRPLYRSTASGLGLVAILLAFNASNVSAVTHEDAIPSVQSLSLKAPQAPIPASPTTRLAQVLDGGLTADQKSQLTKLPIPIVVPTYLPPGFRVVSASGEANRYANGDDDSGYTIAYQGPANTCITIASSEDGPRGPATKVVKTKFGTVKVFTQTVQNRMFIYSYIPVRGNPSLTSGGSIPSRSGTNSGWKPCQPVTLESYTRILQSLETLK